MRKRLEKTRVSFYFPKPTSLIRHLINMVDISNATVRDLRDFRQQGWMLDRLCVPDMFPNTPEIETVVRMRR